MLYESVKAFVSDAVTRMNDMRDALTIVFATSFPLILMAYLSIKPLEQSIKAEVSFGEQYSD